MFRQTDTWEGRLISLAQEAWQAPWATSQARPATDPALLQKAFSYTGAFTAHHSRSFHLASALLPHTKRQAIRTLYAFCRVTDDIVDRQQVGSDVLRADLEGWRRRAFADEGETEDLLLVAWREIRHLFPRRYIEQLIEGVGRDISQHRYGTFADLATYCYGAAATVGLMSMHIVGFSDPKAIAYAVKLGLALQMTNILRDVAEDWQRGRLYLPQEELHYFDLTEDDVAAGQVDERWRAFMRFQIGRNRQLYQEAWPGIALLESDSRLAIAAAARLYGAILDDIEAHDYNVFQRRAHVSSWGKLRLLPQVWWAIRR
jgi:15-cis-phytoene synthase